LRRPRILHVVSTGRRRGAEVFASDLVAALTQEGIEQHVAVLRGTEPVDVAYRAPVTVLADERPKEMLQLRSVRALRRLLDEAAPDVVQAHGGEALKYAFLAARSTASRLVYRRIGSAHPRTTFGLRRAAYGAMMRKAHCVIALGTRARDEMVTVFGVRPERIVIIPNGVDPRRITPRRSREEVRQSLGLAPTSQAVLSLGALTWEKDPLAQVRIAAGVLRRSSEAVFLIAGDGPLHADMAREAANLGLESRILQLGNRPDPGDLLSASDLMLMTSRTEGVPAAAIEAAMAGIPVVAYATGGIAEAVQDGATGLLAPPGDAGALTDHILRLLHEDDARRRMGRAAVEWGRRFEIGSVAPKYLRLYRTLFRIRSGGTIDQEVL